MMRQQSILKRGVGIFVALALILVCAFVWATPTNANALSCVDNNDDGICDKCGSSGGVHWWYDTWDLEGEHKTIVGDLYLVDGSIDLNGGSLTVTGDLYVGEGDLYVDVGSLSVGGDMVFKDGSGYVDGYFGDIIKNFNPSA